MAKNPSRPARPSVSTTRLSGAWPYVAIFLLALVITSIASNIGMTFALFMALLGESVGMYGLTRRGLLAGVYYLVLLVVRVILLNQQNVSCK